MSDHEEDFKDTTSAIDIATIATAVLFMPLLPMLMGWFTLLR